MEREQRAEVEAAFAEAEARMAVLERYMAQPGQGIFGRHPGQLQDYLDRPPLERGSETIEAMACTRPVPYNSGNGCGIAG
jgi:hypothetical protein